jgi:hypothetical protein
MAKPSLYAGAGPSLFEAIKQLADRDPFSVVAIGDIAAERLRQIEQEGWTPAHDDEEHKSGDLALAAAAYAKAPHTHRRRDAPRPAWWPWHNDWWKPRSKHRNCVRAGALIVAELARWGRSATATKSGDSAADRKSTA